MFTGIVEEMGWVRAGVEGGRFQIDAHVVLDGLAVGDSVAHNGCCLTVVEIRHPEAGERWYAVEAVPETLSRTNLDDLRPGDPVNLERPVRLVDRLGGHLLQGHVDAVGEVVDPAPDLRIRVPAHLARYIVEKGSIAVDGCSLTVVSVDGDTFTVAVIPHTAKATTLGRRKVGERVNVEVDVLAKYVESLMDERDRT